MDGSQVGFFFSSRRRHTRFDCDWSSDVCSSDLPSPTSPRSSPNSTRSPSATAPPSSPPTDQDPRDHRSEERRVGKECRSRWSPCREKKETNKRPRVYDVQHYVSPTPKCSRYTPQ